MRLNCNYTLFSEPLCAYQSFLATLYSLASFLLTLYGNRDPDKMVLRPKLIAWLHIQRERNITRTCVEKRMF